MSFDNYYREVVAGQSVVPASQTVTFAAVLAINFDNGRLATCTLTNNLTSLTLSGGVAGEVYCVKLVQDATGSRTLSSPAATILWNGTTLYGSTHTAPTLTTTASKTDSFFFLFDGTNYIEITRNMAQ